MRRQAQYVVSWVLLVAYLPLVVGSVVHMHTPQWEPICDQCAAHVCHPAHLSEHTVPVHHCAFCQILSSFYLAVPSVVVWTALAVLLVVLPIPIGWHPYRGAIRLALRAPPLS